MANFAIMRIEKRKDIASVRRTAEHHLRTVPTPNADPSGTIKILAGFGTPNDITTIVGGVAKNLAKRKDAIKALDLFFGASPEFFKQGGSIRDFEATALKWAGDTFGEDNIVLAVTHEDETTPHVHIILTPVTPKGTLSASHWLDGPAKLRKLQNTFADAMKPLGLERGVEGSKAKHEDIKTYYGKLEPAMRKAEKIIAKADQVEQQQAMREARIAVEATKLDEARTSLTEWQSGLKEASNHLKIEQHKHAEREKALDRKETFLQQLGQELQRQKKALQEAFISLPAAVQQKLAAIFKREPKQPPTLLHRLQDDASSRPTPKMPRPS